MLDNAQRTYFCSPESLDAAVGVLQASFPSLAVDSLAHDTARPALYREPPARDEEGRVFGHT